MRAPPRALLVGAGLCVAAAVAAIVLVHRRGAEGPQPGSGTAAAHRPSLYCEFFDFMHKSVVASYDFAVGDALPPSVFALRAQVAPDGSMTTFPDDQRPAWTYAVDDGTPTLAAPDGQTTIVLYGFKPRAAGILWAEAGVRNNLTRNLEGRCRQAHFDETTVGGIASAQEQKGSR